MYILKSWKAIENSRELFREGLLGVLDFPGVEVCGGDQLWLISLYQEFLHTPNTANLESGPYLCR